MMYFNNKSDTNIDDELNEYGDKKPLFNFDFGKYKWPIIIGLGVLLLIIIIILFSNRNKYYIEINGASEITMYQGDKYIDPGYRAYDKKNRDLTDSVEVDSNVNMNVIGEYTVTYSLKKVTKIRSVKVIEKEDGATYMYLKGDATINLKVGDKFEDSGCVVVDTVDKNLTDKVEIDSNVDTSKEGTYRVIYFVVNSAGVTTSATRTVIVSE